MTAEFSQDPDGLASVEAARNLERAVAHARDRAMPGISKGDALDPLLHQPGVQTAPPLAADSKALARWRTRTLIGTSVLAFLAGALAWHLVGFWSFVSGIVFNPQGGETIARPATVRDGAVSAKASGHLPQMPASAGAATAAVTPLTPATPSVQAVAAYNAPPSTAASEVLADLLQCSIASKSPGTHLPTIVHACPPMRQRLPQVSGSQRADRQLDAREAANRLANGWQTGISQIETGSISKPD